MHEHGAGLRAVALPEPAVHAVVHGEDDATAAATMRGGEPSELARGNAFTRAVPAAVPSLLQSAMPLGASMPQ